MLPGLALRLAPARRPKVIQRQGTGGSVRATTTVLSWTAAVAGNLIVIAFGCETNAAAPTTPAGYSLWPDGNKSNGGMTTSIFYKVAAGGETGVTISHGSNETCWLMREVNAPLGTIDFGTSVSATTANPDPPSVTPASGGIKQTLNIAGCGFPTTSVSAYPSGYSNGNAGVSTGANPRRVAEAEKVGAVSANDAGTFTLAASQANVAYSYSIR